MEPINWKTVLEELKSCMTLTALSAKTGIPVSTLSDLKTGKNSEPQYGAGQRILNVHKREMAKMARANKEGAA